MLFSEQLDTLRLRCTTRITKHSNSVNVYWPLGLVAELLMLLVLHLVRLSVACSNKINCSEIVRGFSVTFSIIIS